MQRTEMLGRYIILLFTPFGGSGAQRAYVNTGSACTQADRVSPLISHISELTKSPVINSINEFRIYAHRLVLCLCVYLSRYNSVKVIDCFQRTVTCCMAVAQVYHIFGEQGGVDGCLSYYSQIQNKVTCFTSIFSYEIKIYSVWYIKDRDLSVRIQKRTPRAKYKLMLWNGAPSV